MFPHMWGEDPGAHSEISVRNPRVGMRAGTDTPQKGLREKMKSLKPPLDISKAIPRIKIPVEHGALQEKSTIGDCTAKCCRSCGDTKIPNSRGR